MTITNNLQKEIGVLLTIIIIIIINKQLYCSWS